ncbi:hypothetical protein [Rhizobium laguerreae]|uniref:Uncharacterized protein n=1 Tax=Rhizobium laguerreae TaxID=1076926 RepID=A0A6N9ZEV6_9HYPH|nr:hypothetical protein [Rhizobium laguerreae]NEH91756.1 hypothetical protein [Rhizobium laguerreae]
MFDARDKVDTALTACDGIDYLQAGFVDHVMPKGISIIVDVQKILFGCEVAPFGD